MTTRRQVTHAIETWTPAQAKKALEKNQVNRPIRYQKVESIHKSMKDGNFDFNGETIKFDWFGNILDGQHRLEAQVKAGVKVKYLVVRNLPPTAQDTMDQGSVRTTGDILNFRGESHAQLLGATLKLCYMVERDNMTSTRANVGNTELLDFLDDHPDVRTSVEIGWWSRSNSVTQYQPSVIATAHWMIAQVNGLAVANDFITRVVTQANEKEGSPILALTRRVNTDRRVGARVHTKKMLAMILKCWKYVAAGQDIKKIYLASKAQSKNTPLPRVAVVGEKYREDEAEAS